MKPGRNDPCPCGSGKKYKHCCLPRAQALAPEDLLWRRIRRAIDPLPDAILRTAKAHFGPAGIDEAWDEFNLWEGDEPFDPDTPYIQVFMSWFRYDWLPEPGETEVPERAHGTTAAAAYLRSAGKRLDPLAARYIAAALEAPYSFYEVVDCEPGRRFRLRDVLLGTEVDAMERSASLHVAAGDLLYAKVVPIEGLALLDGCSPVAIPPVYKPDLIAFRARFFAGAATRGPERVREVDIELRDLFLALADRQLYPEPPRMANTDGDPLEMRTLVYDLDATVGEAFDALKDLAAGMDEDELRADAAFDEAGVMVGAQVTWREAAGDGRPAFDHVTLGTVRIAPGRLEAEVNSARRDERLRILVAERLGDRAGFRVAKVQSIESLLEHEPTADERRAAREHLEESERLAALPEVRAAMSDMLRRHYRAWLDDKIPALGNRTPREAVRDADGREAVEALVRQMERDGERMTPPLDPEIVSEIRAALGMSGG